MRPRPHRIAATIVLSTALVSLLPLAPNSHAAERTILRTNAQQQIVPHQTKTRAEAISDAKRFDLIAAVKTTYRSYVDDMKQANPSLLLLVYVNAAFAQESESTAYPAGWYARSHRGWKVRSRGWGNYLMDISHPGWRGNRARTCQEFISYSGYDGCFLDMLGTAPLSTGYLTAAPMNSATGKVWTKRAWLAGTAGIARAVRQSVAPRPVYGNGLGNGTLYFDPVAPSSSLLSAVDGALAESWLRFGTEGIDSFPSVPAWKRDVSMLSHAPGEGESVHVLVKVWVDGTREQKNRWHKLALASFLLGTRGRSTFSFSYGPTYDNVPLERWWRTPLGEASGPRFATQGVQRRNYSNGVVLVNPGERKHVVRLGGRFVNLRGQIRTSVRMPAHTGRILLKA